MQMKNLPTVQVFRNAEDLDGYSEVSEFSKNGNQLLNVSINGIKLINFQHCTWDCHLTKVIAGFRVLEKEFTYMNVEY